MDFFLDLPNELWPVIDVVGDAMLAMTCRAMNAARRLRPARHVHLIVGIARADDKRLFNIWSKAGTLVFPPGVLADAYFDCLIRNGTGKASIYIRLVTPRDSSFTAKEAHHKARCREIPLAYHPGAIHTLGLNLELFTRALQEDDLALFNHVHLDTTHPLPATLLIRYNARRIAAYCASLQLTDKWSREDHNDIDEIRKWLQQLH